MIRRRREERDALPDSCYYRVKLNPQFRGGKEGRRGEQSHFLIENGEFRPSPASPPTFERE